MRRLLPVATNKQQTNNEQHPKNRDIQISFVELFCSCWNLEFVNYYLQTALLFVPRMSWLRWFRKIPSALETKLFNEVNSCLARSPVVPVENTLYVLFLLADPLSEISMSVSYDIKYWKYSCLGDMIWRMRFWTSPCLGDIILGWILILGLVSPECSTCSQIMNNTWAIQKRPHLGRWEEFQGWR